MKEINENNRLLSARREEECEYLFHSLGPFWHLCTPGTSQEILFTSPEELGYGITSAAICLPEGVREYAIAVMTNHLHDILSGSRERCLDFFDRREKRLRMFFRANGRKVDLSGFQPKLIPIESLSALRNEIVYVNRNGFLTHPGFTPFSYPWSTGMFYYNPTSRLDAVKYAALPYESRRRITRSRIMELPDDFCVRDGNIHIPSFVRIREGECFFRDAHQYFNLLSRNSEAYGEVAKRLGDSVFLTDDELFSSVCALCRREYGQSRPSALAPDQKIAVAVRMREQYHASRGQIRRMLRLDEAVVSELFP